MLTFPIYLDHNATTPCDQRVLETMLPYFSQKFGNAASRSHSFGWEAEEAVEYAREQVARLIHAETKEIIFTSGATEAVNLALKGVYEMYAGKGNHIITCNIEHKAGLDTCRHIEKMGGVITRLPVKNNGLIDLTELESAIRPTTILISIIYANNEIGTLMPMKEICNLAKRKGVLIFTDATQAVGKIPVDVMQTGIDLMAFSSHKIYGPKGAGALYVRRKNPRVKLAAQMDGGGHEKGMRSGTLNVPGIVGLGKACELCRLEMPGESARLSKLRDKLQTGLLRIKNTYVNGNCDFRLPHVVNISFGQVDGEALMMSINKNIALSSGSACTSAVIEPSYVLKAIGVDDALAYSSLRFGLGRHTTEEQIDYTINFLTEVVSRLRKEYLITRF